MTLVTFRAHGIYSAQRICTTGCRCSGYLADIWHVRGQLGDDRDSYGCLNGTHDFPHQFRVLAHGHAVALGVRT